MNRRQLLFAVLPLIFPCRLFSAETLYQKQKSAEDYCFKKSPRLRLWKTHSTWAIHEGVILLEGYPKNLSEEQLKARLRSDLEKKTREKYGSPYLVFILLYVVIPALISALIHWYINRNK